MSILFSDIYTKAIGLFDDPKITAAYNSNRVQFSKLMYTYLQNAIGLFTNPASIGMLVSHYKEPEGLMETFEGDGVNNTFTLDNEFVLLDNSIYCYTEVGSQVQGILDKQNRTVAFPDILPEGKEYSFEQYYVGEFTGNFDHFSSCTSAGDSLVIEQVKGILARLLVVSWAENQRNFLLDIRNFMQDSDFKIIGNDRTLKSKEEWINQLTDEYLQLQNKLSWNIRFMKGSRNIGRG